MEGVFSGTEKALRWEILHKFKNVNVYGIDYFNGRRKWGIGP